jgi:hypothetical protein
MMFVVDGLNNRILGFASGSSTVVLGQAGSFTSDTPGTSASALSVPFDLVMDSQVLVFTSCLAFVA